MTTRHVTDIVLDVHGVAAASATVTFKLTKASYTGAAAYLGSAVTVTTDTDGAYDAELWCDEEGVIATRYRATYPDGTTFTFDLPVGDGSPVLMSALRATAPGVPVANLQTLLDDHAAVIASEETLGHVRIDGTTITIDGDGVISSAGGGAAWVNVLDYGALGDGTTDDTLAIRSAITAAGANSTVLFPAGKTFLLGGAIEPLAGQTWHGYGATLKRGAAVSTTTSTAIVTGSASNVITVASATGLYIGMDMAVYSGATFDTANHRITALSGTTVTLDAAFTTAFASGGTVVSSFPQIWLHTTATDVTILGLEFDGNQANNSAFQKWQNHQEITCTSTTQRLALRDLYLHDAQSEGIALSGTDLVIEACHVLNCQGNGIHLSGTTNVRVQNTYVKNCNLSGTATGHAEGCIIASNSVLDTQIIGNYVENGIGGIAAWDSDDNSSLICTGNIIRNCTSYGFEGAPDSANKVGKMVIANNLFYNSVAVNLSDSSSTIATTKGNYRVIFEGNYLEDTLLVISNNALDLTAANNTVVITATTGRAIDVEQSQNVRVHGNIAIGAGTGIYISGTGNRDLDISHNHCKNNTSVGIRVASDPTANVKLDGNTVMTESTFAASSSYAALWLANGVWATNNQIDVGTNTSGQYGILCPLGGSGVAGAYIANNHITTLANVPSVRCPATSQNNIVVNNGYVVAPSDAGTGNALSQNYPLTGTIPALGLSYGGTGATSAAAARTSLGLAIGTDVQAYDAALSGNVGPNLHGGLTWSLDPAQAANSNAPTAGVVFYQKHYTSVAITVASITAHVVTGGSGLSNCYFGLYDSSGTRLGLTADLSASLTSSGVPVTGALTGSVAIAAGSTFYTALLMNGTSPTFARGGGGAAGNAGLVAANGLRFWTSGSALTALPSSVTVSGGSVSSQAFFTLTK